MDNLIDISVMIRPGMAVWPGDPPPIIKKLQDIGSGDEANVSLIVMGAHCGTHVDAPLHYIPGADGIDKARPEALFGPARVIEVRGGNRGEIGKEELEKLDIREGERVLFKTANSGLWKNGGKRQCFHEGFVHLGAGAAKFLAERKVIAAGIDYLSIGAYTGDGALVHRILLDAGIWIIEGLDLSEAPPGNYELVCLPLKIEGIEAAPARAFLRSLS